MNLTPEQQARALSLEPGTKAYTDAVAIFERGSALTPVDPAATARALFEGAASIDQKMVEVVQAAIAETLTAPEAVEPAEVSFFPAPSNGESALDRALALAADGYFVFPSWAKNRHITGWKQRATRDADTIRQWFTGRYSDCWPSVYTGKFGDGSQSLIVVDVDPDGKAAFGEREFKKQYGLVRTRTHMTPRGGYHLFYAAPYPGVVQGVGVLGEGIDIRSKGGLVHFGQGYTLHDKSAVAAALPQLIEGCKGITNDSQAADRAQDQISPDQEAAYQRAEKIESEWEHAVEGQRNVKLRDLVYAIRERTGIDGEGAMAVGLAYAARVGYPESEARVTVRSAIRSAQNAAGSKGVIEGLDFPAIDPNAPRIEVVERFDPTPPKPPKKLPFDPNASRIGDIFTEMPTAPKFIVQGYLPAVCGQENAIGGAGKTTRQMVEGINIILGRPLWDQFEVVQPGPVLVVTKEDGLAVFKYRLRQVCDALNLSEADQKRVMEHFHVLDMTGEVGGRLVAVDRSGNLEATDLAERLYLGYKSEGIKVMGFDPWNLFSPGERFVNDAEASLMTAGSLIARELECCVRFTGHVSKQVGRQGIIDAHSGRGGAAMGDNARFVMSYVQHDPETGKEWAVPQGAEGVLLRRDLYRIHVTKISYGKLPSDPVWIERDGFAFRTHKGPPASPQARLEANMARVKAFVEQELGQNVRYLKDTLAGEHERYSMGRDEARRVIDRLKAKGELIEDFVPEVSGRPGPKQKYLKPVWRDAGMPSTHEELWQEGGAA